MGWTVIIEDEHGNAKKTLPKEFILSNIEILHDEKIQNSKVS